MKKLTDKILLSLCLFALQQCENCKGRNSKVFNDLNPKDNMEKEIENFIERIKAMPDFDRVKFVILFGSRASGKANNLSDYDFAVYYEGSKEERFKFRIQSQFKNNFDVHIFQDLPLNIQKEVLKGRVIYAQDLKFVYDIAYETIKSFERFKKYYYDYIKSETMQ